MKERLDDYQKRRTHLADMSDEQLKTYFFELADKMVDPLINMAKDHTSKSIERSVLLRMGFSSIEAKGIVDVLEEEHLLSLGAGHIIYVLSKEKNITLKEAGLLVQETDGLNFVKEYFNHE